jgi:ATP-dependent Clp endopeptidase proteolytic subunit ClpP
MLNVRRQLEEAVDPYAGLGAFDVIDRGILDSNSYFLNGSINSEAVDYAIKWLIYENSKPTQHTLTLYINSVGGYLDDAFALIDMMKSSKHYIRTVGIGNIMSSAFLIFAAGTKGFRIVGKNTNAMSHQYSDGIDGKHHDLKAYMKSAEATNTRMVEFLKESTGLSANIIRRRLLPPSDVWLSPQELIDLNIADHIL